MTTSKFIRRTSQDLRTRRTTATTTKDSKDISSNALIHITKVKIKTTGNCKMVVNIFG